MVAGRKSTGATLVSIARECGVSPSTVSAVVRDKGAERGISRETRQQVFEVARQMGYTPNHQARTLKHRKSWTIGVLWSLGGPHSSEAMARQMTLHIQARGYATHIADHMGDPQVTERMLRDYLGRRVDGIIVDGGANSVVRQPDVRRLLEHFEAAVIVARAQPSGWKGSVLVHDRTPALRQVAEHFARSGRERPAMLSTQADPRKRETLAQRFMELTGRPVEWIEVVTGRTGASAHDYWHMLERRFSKSFPYDALWCSTDQGAIATLAWLRKRGLRIPEDVAVVGANETSEVAYIDPPVASIDMRRLRVADRASEMLFAQLDDPTRAPQRDDIECRFVWRASAGEPTPAAPAERS